MRHNVDMAEIMRRPHVVLALIEKEGKFALIRRRVATAKVEWAFPGGVVNEGESDEEAVKREAMDEVLLEVVVKEKLLERKHPNTFVEVMYFHCKPAGDTQLKIGEPDEISEAEWVDANEVLSRFTSDVHPIIRNFVLAHAIKG